MTKLIDAFRNFANAPKNEWSCNSTPLHVFMVFIGMTVPFVIKLHLIKVSVLDSFSCAL